MPGGGLSSIHMYRRAKSEYILAESTSTTISGIGRSFHGYTLRTRYVGRFVSFFSDNNIELNYLIKSGWNKDQWRNFNRYQLFSIQSFITLHKFTPLLFLHLFSSNSTFIYALSSTITYSISVILHTLNKTCSKTVKELLFIKKREFTDINSNENVNLLQNDIFKF